MESSRKVQCDEVAALKRDIADLVVAAEARGRRVSSSWACHTFTHCMEQCSGDRPTASGSVVVFGDVHVNMFCVFFVGCDHAYATNTTSE